MLPKWVSVLQDMVTRLDDCKIFSFRQQKRENIEKVHFHSNENYQQAHTITNIINFCWSWYDKKAIRSNTSILVIRFWQEVKHECYQRQELMRVTETCSEIKLQDLLDHTVSRLCEYLDLSVWNLKVRAKKQFGAVIKMGLWKLATTNI